VDLTGYAEKQTSKTINAIALAVVKVTLIGRAIL